MSSNAVSIDLTEEAPSLGATQAMAGRDLDCQMCAFSAHAQAAVARCRFCDQPLCSAHLAEALGATQIRADVGCRHVYVAAGWLAETLARSR